MISNGRLKQRVGVTTTIYQVASVKSSAGNRDQRIGKSTSASQQLLNHFINPFGRARRAYEALFRTVPISGIASIRGRLECVSS